MTDLFGAQTTMKAISLWQPWASLMAAGVKRHETRHWATAYRGPIAIQAAKTLDLAGAPDQLCEAVSGRFWPKDLPRGVVVAVGYLAACDPAEKVADHLTPADRAAGNFDRGRFAWRIEDIRRVLNPIPLTGRQGLFNWTVPSALNDNLGPVLDHGVQCRRFGWA
ncbi:MAG: ASCH domain-containing protein [Alphaproteobacteria bacterium]|nr:ASCH domain-containing protein [Alphaproteobacteria bacterium]MBU1519969.1 ASCH domain-containing protein [Alphaproteobacteria bacterium]MBU2348227.1 ASCH domain-containing protein [Alphaproteobacteria bacterium]